MDGDKKRIVFKLCEHLHDAQPLDGITIEDAQEDDKTYIVHCGDKGSFRAMKTEVDEEYEIVNSEWISIDGDYYYYDHHEAVSNEYPKLPIDKAIELLNEYVK